MTLPSTGPISFQDINIELGRSPTAPISLNDPEVREMAGKPTGPISLGDLRGKSSWKVTHTLSVGSVTYFGIKHYGMGLTGLSSGSFGSLIPPTLSGTTVTGIFASEDGKCQIALDDPISDPEIHIELSKGGTKYVFRKSGANPLVYNLTVGSKTAWLNLLKTNVGKSLKFMMKSF